MALSAGRFGSWSLRGVSIGCGYVVWARGAAPIGWRFDRDGGPDGLDSRFSSSVVAALAALVAVDDESEQPLDPWPGAVQVVAFGAVG